MTLTVLESTVLRYVTYYAYCLSRILVNEVLWTKFRVLKLLVLTVKVFVAEARFRDLISRLYTALARVLFTSDA